VQGRHVTWLPCPREFSRRASHSDAHAVGTPHVALQSAGLVACLIGCAPPVGAALQLSAE
jgi:hypothetical protein